jgi:hypothetical protein
LEIKFSFTEHIFKCACAPLLQPSWFQSSFVPPREGNEKKKKRKKRKELRNENNNQPERKKREGS